MTTLFVMDGVRELDRINYSLLLVEWGNLSKFTSPRSVEHQTAKFSVFLLLFSSIYFFKAICIVGKEMVTNFQLVSCSITGIN